MGRSRSGFRFFRSGDPRAPFAAACRACGWTLRTTSAAHREERTGQHAEFCPRNDVGADERPARREATVRAPPPT